MIKINELYTNRARPSDLVKAVEFERVDGVKCVTFSRFGVDSLFQLPIEEFHIRFQPRNTPRGGNNGN